MDVEGPGSISATNPGAWTTAVAMAFGFAMLDVEDWHGIGAAALATRANLGR